MSRIPSDEILLRVFVGENDRFHGTPLHHAIVERALIQRLSGATVLEAPEGFGRSRYVRSELAVDTGGMQPMVVEIADTEERINGFLPILEQMVESGLLTLEKVRVLRYRRSPDATVA